MVRLSYIATGMLLLFIAFIISFLMVIKILESNLMLLLIAYIISLIGLILGIYGVIENIQKYFRELDNSINLLLLSNSIPALENGFQLKA
jgi:disulfide bond formation protein DsbB